MRALPGLTHARRALGAAAALVLAAAAPALADDGAHAGAPAMAPAATAAAPSGLPFEAGGPFELVDHTGAPRSERDFRGRYLLIYFGYTACPNTCGIALANLAAALDLMGEAAARITPLFVTVDPEHDTPGRLAAYVANFHPRLVGLTGDPARVRLVLEAFRIEARPAADPGAFARLVDHTPFTYLYGPDGELLTFLPPVMPPAHMAAVLARYVP